MDALQRPLTGLVNALNRFVMVPEQRLLHVLIDADLRITALEHIAAAEHHRGNRSPFLVLEAPTLPDDAGWVTRAEELRTELEQSAGDALDEADAGERMSAYQGPGDLPVFGVALGAALAMLPEHLDGLVVVLAPLQVQDRSAWTAGLTALWDQPQVENARFIVVDLDAPVTGPASERLGERAVSIDARVGTQEARDALQAQLDSIKAAPSGTTGPRGLGAAGPKVLPPPRRAPVSIDPDIGRDLRATLLGVALALQKKDVPEAVRLQKAAVERCRTQGLIRESIVLELALGASLLQAGQYRSAVSTIDDAKAHAEAQKLNELTVQALLARGMALASMEQHDEAAQAYEQAGRMAQHYDLTVLAIEAYRVCGELLVRRRKVELAIQAWKKALDIADAAPADVVSQSSAPQMARALAELCRNHKKTAYAAMLEERADAFENPPELSAEQETAPESEATVSTPASEAQPSFDTVLLPSEGNEATVEPEVEPRHSLKQTLDMLIVEVFSEPEGDDAEASANAEERRDLRDRDVLAMTTMSLPAVVFPEELSKDPLLDATVNFGGDEPAPSSSYRDPRFTRTLELNAVQMPQWVPDIPETPKATKPAPKFDATVVLDDAPPRKPHHTERPAMELPAVVLPEDVDESDENSGRGRR